MIQHLLIHPSYLILLLGIHKDGGEWLLAGVVHCTQHRLEGGLRGALARLIGAALFRRIYLRCRECSGQQKANEISWLNEPRGVTECPSITVN